MKQLLIILFALYSFSAMLPNEASAQTRLNLDNVKSQTVYPVDTSENKALSGAVFSTVMAKAAKDFKKSVKYASNERWMESIDGFVVKYEDKNGIKCRADYDQKGRWIANTRYYAEKDLPKEIRAWVKMDYLDFTINSVQELTFPEHIVYLIQLQNDEKWVHVRICDGEMDVVKEFDNSK